MKKTIRVFLGIAFGVCIACTPDVNVTLVSPFAPPPEADTLEVFLRGTENPQNVLTISTQGKPFPFSFALAYPDVPRGELLDLSIRGLFRGEEVFVGETSFQVGQRSAFSTIKFCGDGELLENEECDDGFQNSNARPDACRNTCVFSFCGDGVKDLVDECDDGNGLEGDGCDSNCTVSACGNGILAPGELCFSLNESLLGLQTPHSLLEIDIDKDGRLDLIASHPEEDSLRVFRNQGEGNFGFFENLSAVGVTKLSKGDLDKDADEDIVALIFDGNSASAQVFLNQGGQLIPLAPIVATYSLEDVLVKDLNLDGNLDLVLVDGGGILRIQWGQGNGTFSGEELISTEGPSPVSVDAKDLTGDGLLDLVVANAGDNSVSIIKGTQNGNSFEFFRKLFTLSTPVKVIADELNGEPGVDFAIAQESGHVRVFKNIGDGFLLVSDFPVGEQPSSLISVDIDLDGDIDLATTNLAENTISVLKNNGAAQFGEPRDKDGSTIRFDTRVSPVDLIQGDLNQDGTPDLAVVGQNLSILLSDP